jgi:polysaccharide export outer membrane protein
MIVAALAAGGCSKLGLSSARYAPAPQAVASASAYQVPVTTPAYQAPPAQTYPTVSSGLQPRGFFAVNLGGPYVRPPAQAAPAPAPVYAAVATAAAPPPSPPIVIPVAAPVSAPAAQPAFVPPYLLDAGDRLRITVFGQDGLTNSYIVDAAGNVTLPLVGTLTARGLTAHQLAYALSERLKQGYIREPKVAIEVEVYRPFFIQGEIANPGQYAYVPNTTVENAVAVAGGFGPRADRGKVTLSRTVGGQTARAAVGPTYPLRPGDTLHIGERWF